MPPSNPTQEALSSHLLPYFLPESEQRDENPIANTQKDQVRETAQAIQRGPIEKEQTAVKTSRARLQEKTILISSG